MRLSLNYQDEINQLVTDGSTDQTVLYRLLGSVPVRTVLESALGLPTEMQQQSSTNRRGFSTTN